MIDVQQRRAADAWFLDHGLPAVLRPGRLVRRLWPRSAPALAAFAVFMINSAIVVEITGTEDKIESMIEVLRPFGIIEMVRTGVVSMTRGATAPSANPPLVAATIGDASLN